MFIQNRKFHVGESNIEEAEPFKGYENSWPSHRLDKQKRNKYKKLCYELRKCISWEFYPLIGRSQSNRWSITIPYIPSTFERNKCCTKPFSPLAASVGPREAAVEKKN